MRNGINGINWTRGRNGVTRSISGGVQTLFGGQTPRVCKADELPSVAHKIEWDLDDDLLKAIFYAETKLSDLICQHEVQVLEFKGYGKNRIIEHRLSPDAFVQASAACN